MKPHKKTRFLAAIAVAILAIMIAEARAQGPIVQPAGIPFTLKQKDGKTPDANIEPSAVEPIGNGKYLLVANDKDDEKGKSLTFIETKTGKFIGLLENFQDSKKNPKWEGLAKDTEGYYYVIGSHSADGVNDTADKLAVRSRLFRFKLSDETAAIPSAFSIVGGSRKEFEIKSSLTSLGVYDADPKKNTVKIEGLAVYIINGQKRLVIGFRAPFDSEKRVQIYIAELPPDSEMKPLKPLTLTPFFPFAAGNPAGSTVEFKLSSIEYVRDLKGFLILTSTEGVGNSFHGNAMWFVSDADIEKSRQPNSKFSLAPASLDNIGILDPKMKAEGMATLPETVRGKSRLVIVYDNDPKTTASPSAMQCVELSGDLKLSRTTC